MRALVGIFVVAACGGGSSSGTTDAPSRDAASIDDGAVDSAIDGPVDAPADAAVDGPPGTPHRYIFDRLKSPQTNTEAQMLGCDLDNDMTADNQLGRVFATLETQGFTVSTEITRLVDRGASLDLVEVVAASLASGPASVRLFAGANPSPPACNGANDTTCRRHFTGTATFDVAANAPNDPALLGTIQQTLRAGPGTAHLPLPIFGGTDLYTLLAARVDFPITETTIGAGKLCGAIPHTEIEMKVYPRIRDTANAAIARDCNNAQTCSCMPNTEGASYQGLFDTNPRDCTVTLAEVEDNSLIAALFAPDVTINGVQALSLGLGVTGVGAVFTP